MPARHAALAGALLALLCANPAALAAPHEINVFDEHLEEPGEVELEMHVNYARGRNTPDFASEIPPDKVWRVMPEIVFGLKGNSEIGLHLPAQRDASGKYHADGLRLRFKHMRPREETQRWFAGFNVEWGYDRPHLSEDRHNFELRGIFGRRDEHWLVAFNPILAWVIKGANKSGKPDFEASLKVMREVGNDFALGVEFYNGFGRLDNFAPRREQDRMLFFALEYEGKGWEINFGVGFGLTPVSDDRVVKAIIGIPFK